MRVMALEEHVTFPEMVAQIPADLKGAQSPQIEKLAGELADVGNDRIKLMDESGITVQVLSVAGPGADLLDANTGPGFARQYNGSIAQKIEQHPGRFSAFAHLPMTNPAAAADELERTVTEHRFCGALINGLTNGEFLDDKKFAPIFERAEGLGVPVYLHPGLPPKAVVDAYYSNLPKAAGNILSIAGWGWHSETALHVLRLIVSGVFDRYPKLNIIIGHMGEMLPMMMARCDGMFRPGETGTNQRTITETLQSQVYITTSGIFTLPPLMAALETFGIDHVLFSVDYPFSTNQMGKSFLDRLPLSVVETEKIASGNAERLLKLRYE